MFTSGEMSGGTDAGRARRAGLRRAADSGRGFVSRDQIVTLAVLGGMVGLFLWDKLRYDLVALTALLAALLGGIVPARQAFSGFSNPVLPLIAGALVLSAAIARSGAVEILVRRLGPLLRSAELQVGVLAACVAGLSAFVKNVGALAIFIPVAFQIARRNERSPSELLMPLSFASLLGGSMTLIGTSPNILIANVRRQLTGEPFHMFDFAPVGFGVAVCGVLFLTIGWRLLPRGRHGSGAEPAFRIEDYTTEFEVGEKSPFVGRTIAAIEEAAGGDVAVTAIIRGEHRRYVPGSSWAVRAGDLLVVEADPQALEQFTSDGKLGVVGSTELPGPAEPDGDDGAAGASAASSAAPAPPAEADPSRLGVVEAVVAAGSALIGRSAAELHLREHYRVNVLAIGRRGRRETARLRRVKFRLGDAIVFQGYQDRIFETLAALGCLPLAERQLSLGRPRRAALPLAILGLAMAAAGTELVPAEIAFVAAALAVAGLSLLTLKEVYDAVEWPILVLIGALIPIGEAVRTTGTTDLLAGIIARVAAHLPGYGILALVLVVTMLMTPILHHAAAVLVMGPIAARLAQTFGYHLDPFLIAVALGAGSDFLSPIGHQSNTLVMGPGGYHFGDYWKLGLPLSLMVVGIGVPLIVVFWPLR
jgi:di/tricarboxylate transporter